MKVQRKTVFEIDRALRELDKYGRSVKLAYAVAKNLGKMKGELEAVRAAGKPSKAFSEYDEKRGPIASSFAIKDKDGSPIVANGQYVITDQAGLDKALKPLQDKYADAIAEQKGKADEIEKLMEEDVEIDFHKVKADLLETEGVISSDAPGLGALLQPLLGTIIEVPD